MTCETPPIRQISGNLQEFQAAISELTDALAGRESIPTKKTDSSLLRASHLKDELFCLLCSSGGLTPTEVRSRADQLSSQSY